MIFMHFWFYFEECSILRNVVNEWNLVPKIINRLSFIVIELKLSHDFLMTFCPAATQNKGYSNARRSSVHFVNTIRKFIYTVALTRWYLERVWRWVMSKLDRIVSYKGVKQRIWEPVGAHKKVVHNRIQSSPCEVLYL